jgi:hypothetical protein
MADSMRHMRYLVLLLALCLASCGDDKAFPVRTYNMGERITLGHLVYVVYETQWLTHLGDPPDSRVPQNRFFLVRMSAVNGTSKEVVVPNFTVEDDKGNAFPEITDETNAVPQYIGYLRRVKPAESAQGHALFDAPPRHYKLKISDEDSERTAYVDIPLSFTSESPDVPQAPSKK